MLKKPLVFTLDELMRTGDCRQRSRSVVPFGEDAPAFVGRQQRKLVDRVFGAGGNRAQQHPKMSQQALDGCHVEEGCRELEGDEQAVSTGAHPCAQIRAGHLGVNRLAAFHLQHRRAVAVQNERTAIS